MSTDQLIQATHLKTIYAYQQSTNTNVYVQPTIYST